MLAFLSIILFIYSHNLYLIFFSLHLLFSIILTHNYAYAYKNDINLKVVTIRILAFGGCILALLKVVCSLPKKELHMNKKNLLMGTRLQWTWSNQKASLHVLTSA